MFCFVFCFHFTDTFSLLTLFVSSGFKIKELRGKLAIGITANFVNRRTKQEAQVQEISGVARIYNQKFFQALHSEIGTDISLRIYHRLFSFKKKNCVEIFFSSLFNLAIYQGQFCKPTHNFISALSFMFSRRWSREYCLLQRWYSLFCDDCKKGKLVKKRSDKAGTTQWSTFKDLKLWEYLI